MSVCGGAAVSPSCMEYIQRKKADTLIADAAEAVAKCAQLTDDVEFVAIDATRTDVAYLARVIDAVVAAGAKTVTVCDAGRLHAPRGVRPVHRRPVPGRAPA